VVDLVTAQDVSHSVAEAGMAGSAGEILALADEARAGTVVSGSYYAEGDSVYVQTRITGGGRFLETVGPVVGSLDARSELVAQLADRVAAALASVLDQEIASIEPGQPPTTYEAFEAYSEGIEAYLRGEVREAAGHFERAAVADPTFHRATLWAARSYTLVGASFVGGLPLVLKADSMLAPLLESPEQLSHYERCHLDFVMSFERWRSLAESYRAVLCMAQEAPGSDDAQRELAQQLMRLNRPAAAIQVITQLDADRGLMKKLGGYWGLVSSAYHMLGDHERELEAALRERQRFPENPYALRLEAYALAALGRTDDVGAVLDSIRSLGLSPNDFGWQLIPMAEELRAHGHRDQAREVLDQWIQSRPEPLGPVAVALYNAERWEDARQLFEGMAAKVGEDAWLLSWLGPLAARRGDRAEVARITELHRSATSPFVRGHTLFRAKIAALLGDPEEAVRLLQRWIDLGVYPDAHGMVHRDIDFESLHDHPAFQEFLRPKG